MRVIEKYPFTFSENFKIQILTWAQQFNEVVWLDSNNYFQKHTAYKAILAVDAFTALKTDFHQAFDKLEEYQTKTNDWLFGYLSYELKNDVECLKSQNFDGLHFPDLYFFQPKKIFLFSENEVEIHYLNMVDDELEIDWQEILNVSVSENIPHNQHSIKINMRTSKDSYFKKVEDLLQHIKRGDIYETNFCQEFFSENAEINPLETFLQLNKISKPPFSTFLKLDHFYALSASPERYLKKTGNTIISQPIKGTAKRDKNKTKDLEILKQLLSDPKERSENIMITDLVRNDLSRIAEKGSVIVEELCKGYTFEQVHQLISTVSCNVKPEINAVTVLRKTFPMGSMTGAPKVSAMKIMEKFEDTKRGLYSGAIGYFTPDDDFDFNVVIRSILYNSEINYVSFSVGGAITIRSTPANEYEECLLKAKAMRYVLE